MRIWESRSNGDPLSLPPRLLTALLGAVTDDERPRLPQAMLDLARHEVDVINCALFLLPDAHGRPQFLSHAQVVEPSTVQGAGQAYTDGFYRRDLALQSALRRRARGNLLLLQGVDDIPDRAYRSACYEEVNTAQRFSVIRPLDGQAHLMLSFYRSARSAPLGAAEVRYLGALAEVLIEAGVPALPGAADRPEQRRRRASPPSGRGRGAPQPAGKRDPRLPAARHDPGSQRKGTRHRPHFGGHLSQPGLRQARRGVAARLLRSPAGTAPQRLTDIPTPPREEIFTMSATLTHLALHVPDLDACITFYETFCGMRVIHRRPGKGSQIVWMAEPGQEQRFIFVIMPGGQPRNLASDDYSHFGFALSSRAAVDDLARRAEAAGCLVWAPRDEPYPVGYYCGLRDPAGNYVEFSYGQPLGPGSEALPIP